MKIKKYFGDLKKEVEGALNKFLPQATEYPSEAHKIMRYIVFSGGGRWRPILCLTIAEKIFGGKRDKVMPIACALELFHSGSLALDDSLCMDNAEVRHGKPACHRKYGEAMTILASIALSHIADTLIAKACVNHSLSIGETYQVVREIKTALGTQSGVIGGQAIDLISTGRKISKETIEYMHNSKAGSLYGCAAAVPAILLKAEERELERLREFGRRLGFTYQIYDDIFDVVGDPATLGKDLQKDKEKNTFVSCHGLDKAKTLARKSKQQCLHALEPLGERADILRDLIKCVFRLKI